MTNVLAENDLILQEASDGGGGSNAAAAADLTYTLVTQRDPEQKVLIEISTQYVVYGGGCKLL